MLSMHTLFIFLSKFLYSSIKNIIIYTLMWCRNTHIHGVSWTLFRTFKSDNTYNEKTNFHRIADLQAT